MPRVEQKPPGESSYGRACGSCIRTCREGSGIQLSGFPARPFIGSARGSRVSRPRVLVVPVTRAVHCEGAFGGFKAGEMSAPAVGRAFEEFAALCVGPERPVRRRQHQSRLWPTSVRITAAELKFRHKPSGPRGGNFVLLSSRYIWKARPICFWLLTHLISFACSLALLSAGNSSEARIAMMAMTTSSSMSVKAYGCEATRG